MLLVEQSCALCHAKLKWGPFLPPCLAVPSLAMPRVVGPRGPDLECTGQVGAVDVLDLIGAQDEFLQPHEPQEPLVHQSHLRKGGRGGTQLGQTVGLPRHRDSFFRGPPILPPSSIIAGEPWDLYPLLALYPLLNWEVLGWGGVGKALHQEPRGH